MLYKYLRKKHKTELFPKKIERLDILISKKNSFSQL